jgi:fatty-acyl-CoA synthase
VRLGVETHDSFSASAVVAELLDLVPSPTVGAVWDSHHPHRMGERPLEIYENFGPRVLLAQVKDARRSAEQEGGWQLVLLGEGEVPVHEMIDLLALHGYDGWVSVEWEKRWQHLVLLRQWLAGTGAPGTSP